MTTAIARANNIQVALSTCYIEPPNTIATNSETLFRIPRRPGSLHQVQIGTDGLLPESPCRSPDHLSMSNGLADSVDISMNARGAVRWRWKWRNCRQI